MIYSFIFNGILIESIATSKAEAFAKSCECYEWLLNLQKDNAYLKSFKLDL